jgi:hypothetical protein
MVMVKILYYHLYISYRSVEFCGSTSTPKNDDNVGIPHREYVVHEYT